MRYFKMILILFFIYIFNMEVFIRNHDYVISLDESIFYNYNEIMSCVNTKENNFNSSLETFFGSITAYDPACYGCIGITASGYDVRDTIYYYDNDYGWVRIIAADPSFKFGTIIKISNVPYYENFITIVLDRGSSIGFNKFSQVDLLFSDVSLAYAFGKHDGVQFDVLRYGY